jgi:hypothetical protein
MRQASPALAAALLFAAQAYAQVPPSADPGAIQQRMMDDLMRRQELERERRKPVAEPLRREPPPAAAQPGAEAVRFMVREIRFTKSEILSAGELEAVAQEFRGRELSLADLQQLAARINDLYKGKGVVTAQAVVPPQDVTTGVVTIRLVEGRLGKVRIKGNDSTDDSYVTARLGLKPEGADGPGHAGSRAGALQSHQRRPVARRTGTRRALRHHRPQRADDRAAAPRPAAHLRQPGLRRHRTRTQRDQLPQPQRARLPRRPQHLRDPGARPVQPLGELRLRLQHLGRAGQPRLLRRQDRNQERPLATLKITGESVARVLSLRQPTIVDNRMQIDIVAGGKTRRSYNWIDNVLLQRTDTEDRNLGVEAQSLRRAFELVRQLHALRRAMRVTQREKFRIERGALRHNRNLSRWPVSSVATFPGRLRGRCCCLPASSFSSAAKAACAAIRWVSMPATPARR